MCVSAYAWRVFECSLSQAVNEHLCVGGSLHSMKNGEPWGFGRKFDRYFDVDEEHK